MKNTFFAYHPKFKSIFTILFLFSLGYAITNRSSFIFWLTVYGIYFLSFGQGVGMALHRVISHSAATLPRPVLYFFALLGSITQAHSPVFKDRFLKSLNDFLYIYTFGIYFIIFFGEEIHNNLHARPKPISNSVSFLQIDVIGLILNTIQKKESRRSYV